nr:hypothetical protein [Tanacetum cinerariifolium]
MAKKIKELIKKDELTVADLEGVGLEILTRQYKNDVELEYHVEQLKAAVFVVNVKSKWSYGFLTSIVVRRSDKKEYEFSYADLPKLILNDIKDMSLLKDELTVADLDGVGLKILMRQYKNDVELEYHVEQLKAAVLVRVAIQNHIEDLQPRVESYQHIVNLTKPIFYFLEIDQKIPYTTTGTEIKVVYFNQHNMKSLMKLNEVNKFCDSTLLKDEESISSKDEGVTRVKAFIDIAEDELAVRKADVRKIENLNEVRVKELRSDDGIEFIDHKVEEFYDEKWIS